MATRLQVADHRHAPETPVQKQHTHTDAQLAQSPEQTLEDILHLLAAIDGGQGEGVALTAIIDVGGGVGVEVTGAALGLAAEDLAQVEHGLAVVGDQHQVDGHLLLPAAQSAGHVGGQGAVEAAEQFVAGGQVTKDGFADGFARVPRSSQSRRP